MGGRYDLTNFEWSVIAPLLPQKSRGGAACRRPARVERDPVGCCGLGSPWPDLPERYGPYTTAHNRFVRWRRAGIWDAIMDAITKAYDGHIQMIDSSSVRVHQHAAGAKKGVQIVAWAVHAAD